MSNSRVFSKANLHRDLFAISLAVTQRRSLQSQLTSALRRIVSASSDLAGARLPASRVLAQELSISRTTVQASYDQMISEGIFVSRQGSGTFIAENVRHLETPPRSADRAKAAPKSKAWRPFQTGVPDHSLMPHKLWAGHLERAWRTPVPELLAQPDPLGWYPMRHAIADHLEAWRELRCDPEQVIITSGAREAFELVLRGLLSPGQDVVIEDPCWPKLRTVLAETGSTAYPVRIDAQGLAIDAIPTPTKAVVVSPSRHYPTGISLPLSRRVSLLDWARERDGVILEDDYDSEFRYRGQPLPSLSGLDGLTNSIYLGSFSKLVSPTLRIGYLVVPKRFLPSAQTYLRNVGPRASLVPQPALASFMQSGDYAMHLRRMRRIYGARQKHLLAALAPVSDLLDVQPDPAGMHLCVPLHPALAQVTSDVEISAIAQEAGVRIDALSSHSVLPNAPQALLFGYAGFDEETLSKAADTFIAALRSRFG